MKLINMIEKLLKKQLKIKRLSILLILSLFLFVNQIESVEFRHVLTPYGGFHKFDSSKNLKSGFEGGLKVGEILNSFLSVELGVGVVAPKSILEGEFSSSDLSKVFNANLIIEVFKYNNLEFFVSGGINGNLSDLNSPDLIVGGGGRLRLSNDLALKGSILYQSDLIGYFGIEKGIDWFGGTKKPSKPVSISLQSTPVITQYVFPKPFFSDILNHWAKNEILMLASQGIISEKKKVGKIKFFKPKDNVNRAELAKMLISIIKLSQIKEKSIANIKYKISGDPTFSYVVNLFIEDNKGNKIKNLISNKSIVAGEYKSLWRGLDENSDKIGKGVYILKLIVKSPDNNQSKEISQSIVIKEKHSYIIATSSLDLQFEDIDANHWAKDYVNEAVELGFMKPVVVSEKVTVAKTTKKGLYFNPLQEVNRLDFIDAVGRVLYYFGAKPIILANISYYSDSAKIPFEARPFLDVYISQFGYGGDDFRKLNPAALISRAEMAVLLHRLLKWKWDRETQKIPILQRKVTKDSLLVMKKSLEEIKKEKIKLKKKKLETRMKKVARPKKKRVRKPAAITKPAPVHPQPIRTVKKSIVRKRQKETEKAVQEASSKLKEKTLKGLEKIKKWRLKFLKKNKANVEKNSNIVSNDNEAVRENKVYRVLAGGFLDERSAVICQESLKKRGIISTIWISKVNQNKTYNVQIGVSRDRSNALSYVKKLREMGYMPDMVVN